MPDSTIPIRVTVAGSINMDLVLRCDHFPQPGTTIVARSYDEISGGKGANQAVSAAKAGAQATMLGRVGEDAFGERLTGRLKEQGIDCRHVLSTPNCESGLAMIMVDPAAQNSIIFIEGANGRFTPEDALGLRDVIESSDVVLLQLEIPLETVREVIRIAKAAKVRVILDPAPVPSALPEALLQVDLICPNEHEAEQLTGITIDSVDRASAAAASLHAKGAQHVVITMGSRGSFLFDENGGRMIPAFITDAVDTTAAGDAFAGALAVYWAQHGDLDQAVRFGNAAGAIAASRMGAQPSMGTRSEIEALWGSIQ
ncbi:ribokinase [Blastopirellula marina]|uniref:Ribokinase n=1 Tax=Blastopirellula marina TaxID=124 RepID=A0A2S8F0T0_9BACT|nr:MULTISPECIES: ribokinase [Pirellulaceae]PQO25750.1 ribokinase [Blastopirellula marina]RCS43433.1 ribokinase [Bremerella cremea]